MKTTTMVVTGDDDNEKDDDEGRKKKVYKNKFCKVHRAETGVCVWDIYFLKLSGC